MQKIKTLSADVIAKIAAGEVIERPSFAVKELIENAIDANATAITIHTEESGLRRIQVIDNGEGMSKEDLKLSFLPHTTSKLKNETDLLSIKTLGFRGEALSSIAAIGNITIQSRQKNDSSGSILEIRQGKIVHSGSIGTPPGTIITVDNLFSTVPARKKFLKSSQTEFRHISDMVLQCALSYPTIHFLLTHNKKTVFDLPVKKDEIERIALIFGEDTVHHFIPLSFSDSYFTITGFIGKPNIAAKHNQKQFIFVNRRSISDKLISLAVKESFGTLLPSSTTPTFSLQLTLPFETVDVNVHPRKEQVSFLNSRMIFDLVKQAVSETLLHNNITFALETFDNSMLQGETTSFSADTLKNIVLPWNRTDIGVINPTATLLQIHQTYIQAITKDGLVLVDQHAAHERILFQQFIKTFEQEKAKNVLYTLPKPLLFSFSLSEKQLLEEYKKVFENGGFYFEKYKQKIILKKIPLLFKGRKIEKILKDMLTDLLENRRIKNVDTTSNRMLSFLSCRAAVKAGDVLTQKQMKTILHDLEKSENNETCPHGRPTKIIISLELLHKYFKRI